MLARGDSNPRPLPCQSAVIRLYENLQRGTAKIPGNQYKTALTVGWSVG
jgi:hypothetical protein